MNKHFHDIIREVCNLDYSEIAAVFMYGSQVYGTYRADSDFDFIVINRCGRNDEEIFRKHIAYDKYDINVHLYTIERFQEMIAEHQVHALECLFLPENYVPYKSPYLDLPFHLDKAKLRHEFSSKASNSFVKAKKKLILDEEDNYIGLKSMFHSLRIINYGCQLAMHGRIIDYGCINHLWEDIKTYQTWEELNKKYKPIYNEMMSEFRLLAPK